MKCGIFEAVLSLGFAHPLCSSGSSDHPRCLSCRNMWLHGPRLVVHLNPSPPRFGSIPSGNDYGKWNHFPQDLEPYSSIIAIENGHRNSEFSYEKWWIFPVRYVNVYQRVDFP